MPREIKVEGSQGEDRISMAQALKDYPHLDVENWDNDKLQSATRIFELFLVSGLNTSAAAHKIVELLSPPRVTQRLRQLKYKGLTCRHDV